MTVIGAVEKDKKKKTPKPKVISDNVKVVEHFVVTPRGPDKLFWPKECEMARKLLEKYELRDLLSWHLNHKVESLAMLFVLNLDYEVNRAIAVRDFRPPEPKKWELSEEKVGESIDLGNRLKTIRDL